MKLVQPIRDLDTLQRCFEIAREHDAHRKTGEVCWERILLVGLNTSLRVSDFRRFKVSDLRGRDYAQMQAKKTGKEARILINPAARKEINRLLAGRKPDEYIFQSRQKDGITHKSRPISRQRCYQIMNTIAKKAGIEERIGCHTLRKTFCYHQMLMSHNDSRKLLLLQRMLNHSSPAQTLDYIGITSEEIDEAYRALNLGSVAHNYLVDSGIGETDAAMA